MSDLLPCPFCGIVPNQPENLSTGIPAWEISCKSFCVRMRDNKKKSLIARWNKRVCLLNGAGIARGLYVESTKNT